MMGRGAAETLHLAPDPEEKQNKPRDVGEEPG